MIFGALKDLIRDEEAGTLTMTAVMFPMLLGFGGLGLDATGWYMNKRDVQNMVDMAVIDAVHTGNYYQGEALEGYVGTFLDSQGFDSETDRLTINTPPSQGDYAGQGGFYEIILERDVPLYFVNAFYGMVGGAQTVTVLGRAVAGTLIIGTQCIVALDETADRAMNFSGNTDVAAGCGVTSNSSSSEAIYIGGSAELTAAMATTVGDMLISGGGILNVETPAQSFASPASDPYDTLDIPPSGSCDFSGTTRVRDDEILTPGTYCGDIVLQGQNITFDPGEYIIHGGDFVSNANAEFSGSEVTFFLTGGSPSDIGTVNMNGNTTAELSAPTSGDYQGILFMQDPDAIYRDTTALFNGGSDLLLDGVLYFPSGDISFTGGASTDPACLQLYGATVSFNGSSYIGNDDAICTALGLEVSPQVRVQLVE